MIFCDVILPGLSGPDLLQRLAERWPRLKVILMSGYTDGEPIPSAAGDRVVRFLRKPFDLSTLANEIHIALGE